MTTMVIVQNADGFEGVAEGVGPAVIWCESCGEETIHIRYDDYTLAWMRACGDKQTTHYCNDCNERRAGA